MFAANAAMIRTCAGPGAESRHESTAAIAARPKMSVQAGPNSQSGGCQDGFFNATYQGPSWVTKAPKSATANAQRNAAMIGLVTVARREITVSGPLRDALDP